MLVTFINAILIAIGAYLAVGALLAPWIHAKMRSFDAAANGAGIGFRVLVTPGIIALWPMLIARMRRAEAPDPDLPVRASALRRRHGILIQLLAITVPILAGTAIAFRPPRTIASDPLPRIIREDANAYPGFDITTRLRADAPGSRWQFEVDVRERIPLHHPLVYWMPAPDAAGEAPSQFIGALDSIGMHRFSVPQEVARGRGNFVILSVQDGVALNRHLVPKG